jgi:DnaK suppressor protein
VNATKYQKILSKRYQELGTLIKDTKSNSSPVKLDQTSVGRLSRMDAIQGQAMAEEVKRRRIIEMKCILAALDRIKEDEYGYCLKCGEEIAPKRLDLDPSVSLCNKCAI